MIAKMDFMIAEMEDWQRSEGVAADNLRQPNEFFEPVFQDLRRFIAHKLGKDAGSEQYIIRGSVSSGTALRIPPSDFDVDLVFSKNYLWPRGSSWDEFREAVNRLYGICVEGGGFSNISCVENQNVTRSFQLLHQNGTEIEIFIKYKLPGTVNSVCCFGTDHGIGDDARTVQIENDVQFHLSVRNFNNLTDLQQNAILIKYYLKHVRGIGMRSYHIYGVLKDSLEQDPTQNLMGLFQGVLNVGRGVDHWSYKGVRVSVVDYMQDDGRIAYPIQNEEHLA